MDINLGIDYSRFIDSAEEEHKKFIYELDKQGVLDMEDKNLDKIRDIKDKVEIVVFTETGCKDSATTMPFLMKLSEFNQNISVKFLRREGSEELLQRLTGEQRVPTILVLDENRNVKRKYIEFPLKVKEVLTKTPNEEIQLIIDNMRTGKFNKEIQEDLIRLITGEDYKYITFIRKDS